MDDNLYVRDVCLLHTDAGSHLILINGLSSYGCEVLAIGAYQYLIIGYLTVAGIFHDFYLLQVVCVAQSQGNLLRQSNVVSVVRGLPVVGLIAVYQCARYVLLAVRRVCGHTALVGDSLCGQLRFFQRVSRLLHGRDSLLHIVLGGLCVILYSVCRVDGVSQCLEALLGVELRVGLAVLGNQLNQFGLVCACQYGDFVGCGDRCCRILALCLRCCILNGLTCSQSNLGLALAYCVCLVNRQTVLVSQGDDSYHILIGGGCYEVRVGCVLRLDGCVDVCHASCIQLFYVVLSRGNLGYRNHINLCLYLKLA